MCPSGTTNCNGNCVDLKLDARNCGSCGRRCPGPVPSTRRPGGGSPSCDDGECKYTCFPGFADCDEFISNGCEVDLRTDPRHCGTCGTDCPLGANQPCVAGKCLSRECDGGTVN